MTKRTIYYIVAASVAIVGAIGSFYMYKHLLHSQRVTRPRNNVTGIAGRVWRKGASTARNLIHTEGVHHPNGEPV